ncbi:MAG: GTPase Era [Termitinemataceae bacterium]|nr:MAG: GTPase Era [Termitinemataceae bacterium]
MPDKIQKKSAFVAVVGRPSVGKSTLINLLCGAKVSIVSPVPQTTRNSIRGIVNRERGQIVFVDTPGRHNSEKKLNRKLIETADRVQNDADLILYMLDATRLPQTEEEICAASLPANMLKEKIIVAVNKIDNKLATKAAMDAIETFLENTFEKPHIFKISALKKDGVEEMLNAIFDLCPVGEPYYDTDCYTDQDVRFRISEIVREKATERLREEIPHSIYVEVADCELHGSVEEIKIPAAEPQSISVLPDSCTTARIQTLDIRAFIRCERESQKGMIVGKGGKMIRSIRLAALKELKEIFDWNIKLDLRVKTASDWRHNDSVLKKLF